MSDEVAKEFESKDAPKDGEAPVGRSVTLSVTLHPNGEVQFSFPTGGKALVYGMIELARAQFDKMVLINESKSAQVSRGGIPGLMKRMNGG